MSVHDKAHRRLLKVASHNHPKIYSLVRRNGVHRLERRNKGDLFQFLARTATGQQLSTAAARTIWTRIEAVRQDLNVTFQELCRRENVGKLRKCGLSKNKVRAFILLGESFRTGRISHAQVKRCDCEGLRKLVTDLWGFGQWSADMVAMFFVGLPDIWPDNDTALNRGMRLLVTDESPAEVARHYSPYRTYLARHIWKGLDTGTIYD
jgi:DNA-3-methyladenine glycosylase II